jgi:hypothetical protein
VARLQACDHPPGHHYTPDRPSTFPACANHSNMLCDSRFMLWYLFPAVVVVCSSQIEFWLVRLVGAHPLTTTHLVVLTLFPYAQIVLICYATFVSYWDMYFLLWLCVFRIATTLRPPSDRPPTNHDAPSRPGTFPACANHSNMPCE